MNRWVEIDLRALSKNIALIKKTIGWPKVKLMAVVKANAYGHGAIKVAEVCQKTKVDYLAVATFDEAMQLRGNKIALPVLIIGYIDKKNIAEAIKNNIALSLYCEEVGQEIIATAKKLHQKAKVHLKLDTGMHRLGFLPKDFLNYYRKLVKNDAVEVEYIYTHFADFSNAQYSKKQVDVLKKVLDQIKSEGLTVPEAHISRSDSIAIDDVDFSMVRPGLAIYGLSHSISGLKPALSFKTKIAQVKNIDANECVGYCLTFKSKKPMKIAAIACGYADGYGRNFSNKGEVIVRGKLCPVIGRVCMNLTIIDITSVPDAQMNDDVILIGRDGNVEVSAEKLARKIETIPYEIVARIPADIPRIYKK